MTLTSHFGVTGVLLALAMVLFAGLASRAGAQGFVPTFGNMTASRVDHSEALLFDGSVLLAGGSNNTADVYSPATRTFTATANTMSVVRSSATATRLPDGTVLVAGGIGGTTANTSANIYNPSTRTFSPTTGAMTVARYRHTATLLPDNSVLLTGGLTTNSQNSVTATAEIYFQAGNRFFATLGAMSVARRSHTATLLTTGPDAGKVLIVGGTSDNGTTTLKTAQLYNPATQTFSATGSMATGRFGHTATRLNDGTVLICGGQDIGSFYNSAEIYDPATGTFSSTAGPMASARVGFGATLLYNGNVLISGGYNGSFFQTAEIYRPALKTFAAATNMVAARAGHTATALGDGAVLLTGGQTTGGASLASAELYTLPFITSFSPAAGVVGTQVTLTGANFTTATRVNFNGATAGALNSGFSVVNSTTILAFVPAAGSTGRISVVTPGGTGFSNANFAVVPTITGFTPVQGLAGTSVVITGTGFTGMTGVTFHGVAATSATLNSSTQITATVPVTSTGRVAVTTSGGTATSAANFTYAEPGSLVVTTTTDVEDSLDGLTSLREAITLANSRAGADTVSFNIPAGQADGAGRFTLVPATALPTLSGTNGNATTIDGYTQPGASTNTLSTGTNAVLKIVLTGLGMTSIDGLTINAANCVVRGLVINNFNYGVFLDSESAASNLIAGNFIGTDASGSSAVSNMVGIYLQNSMNCTIGGTTVAARNLVSGNNVGISISGESGGNLVQGNFIGTDAAGAVAVANSYGIDVSSYSSNTIGGLAAGAGNVIAFSFYNVFIGLGTGQTVRRNSIYATQGASGIYFGGTGTTNDNLDGDTGTNNQQNYPVLTGATGTGNSVTVIGKLNSSAGKTFDLDFFASVSANQFAPGDGQTYLGSQTVTTDATTGDVSFSATFPKTSAMGEVITATATRTSATVAGSEAGNGTLGDTSTFSRGVYTNAEAPSLVVTTASDSAPLTATDADGLTSLREAMTYAVNHAGADTISFAIPGTGLHTISPSPDTALPSLTGADGAGTVIDGYTQPGSSVNTLSAGTNAVLNIEIKGQGTSGIDGFTISAANCTVKGLVVNNFRNGFNLGGATASATVTGNFIGTNAAGTSPVPNFNGLLVTASSTVVGGPTVAARNLISGNTTGIAVTVLTAPGCAIVGNLIGTNAAGTGAVSNNIGVNVTGSVAHIVGGTSAGAGNVIAYNRTDGVTVSTTSRGNAIRGNSIFGNGTANADMGIDLLNPNGANANDSLDPDTGGNGKQNYPVLSTSVSQGGSTTITGSLNSSAGKNFDLDFYASPPSGRTAFGEGQTYLGTKSVATDAVTGNITFSATFAQTVAKGQLVTATATRTSATVASGAGNGTVDDTSEFSAAIINTEAPAITSFSPDPVQTGIPVTISGTGFTGTTAVTFNDMPATSFTVNSATQITATVPDTTTGPIKVTTPGGTATSAGNITVDNTRPTVAIALAAGQATPTNTSPIRFTVTFSEPVTAFTRSDVNITNGSLPAGGFSGSGATYNLEVTPTSNGPATVNIPAAVATDAAGNLNVAAPQIAVTYDTVPPSATITQAAGQADPTSASPINFTVTFSEAVTGFAAEDLTITNGSLATGGLTGTGATYAIAITPAGDGAVTLTFAAGAATDAAGNGNAAPALTDNSVTYGAAPTITSFTPTTGGPGTDVTITGTSFAGTTVVTFNGTPATGFTVNTATTITATAPAGVTTGKIEVTTPSGTAISAADFVYDTTAPVVNSVNRAGAVNPTAATSVDFTVSFSESVTGVDTTDFTLTKTGLTGGAIGGVTGSGGTYTVTVNGYSGSGTLRVNVGNDGTIVDAFGNALAAGYTAGQTYSIAPAATTGASISEYRTRGANGTDDEYVEILNATEAPLNIGGWSLAYTSGVTRTVTLPVDTVIPTRAHLLFGGTGYSLGGVAPADVSLTSDIDDGSSLVLRNAASAAVDSVVETVRPNQNGQYAFVKNPAGGATFLFVSTTADSYTRPSGGNLVAILGAPGPQNLASRVQRDDAFAVTAFDTGVAITAKPNQARVGAQTGPNAPQGTLLFRRVLTNSSNIALTNLRFRVTKLTTTNNVTTGQSDIRVISSATEIVAHSSGTPREVLGLTLDAPSMEAAGGTADKGGGLNASVTGVTLPSPLMPGQSRAYNFLFRVATPGTYSYVLVVEATP